MKSKQPEGLSLRQRAEIFLKKQQLEPVSVPPAAEALKLVNEMEVFQIELKLQEEELLLEKSNSALRHNLEIHHIELELQNEELINERDKAVHAAEKYFALYNNGPAGHFTFSSQGEILELNLAGAMMLGKAMSRLIGSSFAFFITDDTKPEFNHFVKKVFTGKIHESCNVTLLLNNNKPKYIHILGINTGNEKEFLATIVDITGLRLAKEELITAGNELAFMNIEKQKRADELAIANIELAYQNDEKQKRADELINTNIELDLEKRKAKLSKKLTRANENLTLIKDALHETNEYLENLIDNANAPIIVWNPKFHIERFNHAAEFLTGWKEAEVIGESIKILFSGAFVVGNMDLLSKTKSGKRLDSVEIEIQHRDKSLRTVLWNSATIFERDGCTPVATIAQGQDITRRKKVEQQLLESEHNLKERVKELNELISMSHLTDKFEKLEDIYNEFVKNIVPGSLQFPEKIYASLEIESKKYCNIEYFKLPQNHECLSATITLFGKKAGELIVAYTDKLPFIDNFEQNLISMYALMISKITERIRNQQLLAEKGK